MPKRIEQLDALVSQELFALEQVEDFEAEQLLGSDGIDIRNREPLTVVIP
jgi:hypothetical protein